MLKNELDKLRDENKGLRETIQKASCPSCGFATSNGKDTSMATEEQQLRIENSRLKAEVSFHHFFLFIMLFYTIISYSSSP